MLKKICIIFIVFFSSFSGLNAQWETAGSFNLKNEFPGKGIGIQVGRKLPVQFPGIGLKVRFEAEFYGGKHSVHINDSFINADVSNNNFILELIAEFFQQFYQPYLGIGLGTGFFSMEDDPDYSFLISALAGLEFAFSDSIIPFLELQMINYFSGFQYSLQTEDINKNQFKGVIGLRFEIN